jgi:hypothetical protein
MAHSIKAIKRYIQEYSRYNVGNPPRMLTLSREDFNTLRDEIIEKFIANLCDTNQSLLNHTDTGKMPECMFVMGTKIVPSDTQQNGILDHSAQGERK